MKYTQTRQGIFVDRPNRFVAHVLLDGRTETVHVKNTGRCRELLVQGRDVILAGPFDQGRKTRYDLIAVEKPGLGLVNIDSQAPNAVVEEWLRSKPAGFTELTLVKPEFTWGQSRFDFMLQAPERRILMEVKGCTLERNGVGYFPDAPTERGTRHLHELCKAAREGWDCYLTFAVTMPSVTQVLPNRDTDPDFADALRLAKQAGVHVLVLTCIVTPDRLIPDQCFVQDD